MTLTLAAVAAGFGLCAPAPSFAGETPVGLEAQGVDPSAALDNSQGLDVRDELGRPVSAAVIREQLKQAEASAAADATYASKLPQAKKVTLMLELLQGLGDSVAAAFERGLARFMADAGLPKPPQEAPARGAIVFFLVLAACSAAGAVLSRLDLTPSGFSVLRC